MLSIFTPSVRALIEKEEMIAELRALGVSIPLNDLSKKEMETIKIRAMMGEDINATTH